MLDCLNSVGPIFGVYTTKSDLIVTAIAIATATATAEVIVRGGREPTSTPATK
jgi:hypothetical protein